MEGSEAQNLFKAFGIIILCLCYCYLIVSKLPKGKFRLFALLPIFSIFILIPLSVSRPLPSFLFGGFIAWLANFKLLLYAFNEGPLSTNDIQKSILKFILFAAFPIKMKENLSQNNRVQVLPLTWGTKCLVFALMDFVQYHINSKVVLCCMLYLVIEIIFGVCEFIVWATLGLELDPPSNEPYISTSLQDFWGNRWNCMVSDALRHTIFKPIRSMALNFMGQKWALMSAMMVSFIVSGLMHELIFYYTTRVKPTWEVTWFFVLQGVCVVLEMKMKRALAQKWKLHWALSIPLTVGFVMGTGFWLFLPQLMRNHIDTRATDDVIAFGKYIKEIVRLD